MSKVNGNNVTVYVDPVKGNDNSPFAGDPGYPYQTFGAAMQALLGSQLSRGARTLQIVNNGVTQAVLPPEATGSFGTEGLFAWGGNGPLGLDAVPMVIQSDMIIEKANLTVDSVTGTSVVITIASAVLLNQFKGHYLEGLAPGGAVVSRYLIISNTANGGSGPVTFVVNAIPGDIFPALDGVVQVVKNGAVIQLPVEGEYGFNALQVGIQGVEFDLQAGTLSFRACQIYAQGCAITSSDEGEVLLTNTLFTGDPSEVYEKWDGIVGQAGNQDVNPFLDTRLGGIYIAFGTDTGSVDLFDDSILRGPVAQFKGSFVCERSTFEGHYSLADTVDFFIDDVANFSVGGQQGTTRSTYLIATDFIAIGGSQVSLDTVDIGGAAVQMGTASKLFCGDVQTLSGHQSASVAFSLASMSLAFLKSTTAFIGATGLATVENEAIANYAVLTANADPPANTGGWTGTLQAGTQMGLPNGCRIEILP